MDKIEGYRRRAAEVERQAKWAPSKEYRRRLLALAQSWLVIADQRESMMQAPGTKPLAAGATNRHRP